MPLTSVSIAPPLAAISGPPTDVQLAERLRDYMVIGWKPPAKNGGADIRGYYLDYRTVKGGVTSQWHELNTQAVTGTTYKVSHESPLCSTLAVILQFFILTF